MNKMDQHSKCQDGVACRGPGCRVSTGKTKVKKNWARPKRNQHEASRDDSPAKGKNR